MEVPRPARRQGPRDPAARGGSWPSVSRAARSWRWVEFREVDGHEGPPLRLRVFGTGDEIPDVPDPYRHVGVAFTGPFVWHVYERSSVIV